MRLVGFKPELSVPTRNGERGTAISWGLAGQSNSGVSLRDSTACAVCRSYHRNPSRARGRVLRDRSPSLQTPLADHVPRDAKSIRCDKYRGTFIPSREHRVVHHQTAYPYDLTISRQHQRNIIPSR